MITNRELEKKPISFFPPEYSEDMSTSELLKILDRYQCVFDWCEDYSSEFLIAIEACKNIRRMINRFQGACRAMA